MANPSGQADRLSSLPDGLLVLIISFLSFKECITTSVLQKRWKNLCHETTNIAFVESKYVDRSAFDEESKRVSFVHYMSQWLSRFQGRVIESFKICMHNPVGFAEHIESLIEFVASRKVKNLVLCFENPGWRNYNDASSVDVVVQLPACVYNLTTLESLEIYACGFEPSRFTNTGMLRSLSIRWIKLVKIESLISKSPSLESLSINYCWGPEISTIASRRMREFVLEYSDFDVMSCEFDLPNVDIFKYSGRVPRFQYKRMNRIIKEVSLEIAFEREYDQPTTFSYVAGELLRGHLNALRSARTLIVCPYILQVIQENVKSVDLLCPGETQHLVLQTTMLPREYKGISILLNSVPDLETLTIDVRSPSLFAVCSSYRGIYPDRYWVQNKTFKCLKKTLKVVVLRNFEGHPCEMSLLMYLIGYGSVLESIDLYLKKRLDSCQMHSARSGAERLRRMTKYVRVLLH